MEEGAPVQGSVSAIELGEDRIVKVVCTLHGSKDGGGMAGVLLIGKPEVKEVGGAYAFGGPAADHDARVLGELEDGAESVARIEESVRSLELAYRIGVIATVAIGGIVTLAVVLMGRREGRALGGAGGEEATTVPAIIHRSR